METISFNKFTRWVLNYNFIEDEEREKVQRILKELKKWEIDIYDNTIIITENETNKYK